MQKLKMLLVAMLFAGIAQAQNTLKVYIYDSESKEPLIGAVARFNETSLGNAADVNGQVTINRIPDGTYQLIVSFIGYKNQQDSITFPRVTSDSLVIMMEKDGEELDEVQISSTRSTRSIKDIPTRVEFIAGEELDEKANMKPGDIRMVLSESTGIQVQQTSATSANASIRIQGLDGRYTQMLKDGFPLYSGFAGGLSLLQTPPLDLKQVEVIKGSASTLYGGGAIAGLVNLISKTPSEERELRFFINGTTAGGLDLNGFYSKQFGKSGLTLLATRNSNAAYDPSGIGLTAIPKFERYNVNPRFFYTWNNKTKMNFGVNTSIEEREGGNIKYIRGNGDSSNNYFEKNNTKRFSTQFAFDKEFGKCDHLTVKNSFSYFNRLLATPGYKFDGTQYNTYSEINYASHQERVEWVGGVNVWTENFTERKLDTIPLRNYKQVTVGAFIQNTYKATEEFSIESGMRTDYVFDYGFAFLPRVSLLYKFTPALSSRLGGGLGYKAPTIFTEESERLQFRNVMPISSSRNKLERSYGVNWDVNYRVLLFGKLSFNINQMFFYTQIERPLLLMPQFNGALPTAQYIFENSNGHIDTRGAETNIKLGLGDFKLFLGYTYTDTRLHFGANEWEAVLVPKHRVNSVLMYEVEEKWKIGLEAYYFSPQKLSDARTGRDYWICGFMVERLWERISVFINFENFLDARQTRFDRIYTGSVNNPVFRDIYAPLDGFVTNGGIKLRL